jgi:nucleoside-diphosphate-sugar epimerase
VLALDPTLPRNVYDLSKALGENLCLTRSDGRAAVARLSNVFDLHPLASGFLSELLARAAQERSIVLEVSPAGGRDYIHLDDAVAGLLAMDATTGSGIVNIASGDILTNGELGRIFRSAGWRLVFTGRGEPPLPPTCDITRLGLLGVGPRDVRDVLRRMLSVPGYFRG